MPLMEKSEVQKKDLSVEIEFLEGLHNKLPDDIEILRLLGDDYTKAGLWKEGLEVDLRLTQLLPKDPLEHFK